MGNPLRAVILALTLCGCAKQGPPEPSPSPTPDLRARCCAQCRAAASTDPSAMDLTLVPCGDYTGTVVNQTPVLDAACGAWFADHALLVQDCR